MIIFIGKLSLDTQESGLRKAFEEFGSVDGVMIVTYDSGRSKGFGFADMPNNEEATKAIAGLHITELDGKTIAVLKGTKTRGELQIKHQQSFS